jgi:hypothetical protein
MAQKTIEQVVRTIYATNYLYCTVDELDARGTGHNKPLYKRSSNGTLLRCLDRIE